MRIGGLQKVTLLDYPGKIACTVFLSGCNLRCPFCHNPALVFSDGAQELSTEELLAFLQTRRKKLDGVCITGGEPTLHPDLQTFLRSIHALGFSIKLDTNGTNPKMLGSLLQERLVDYVAMDIKNSPERYVMTCGGVDQFASIRESAALLMAGKTDYEFRTTVCHPLHRPEDMIQIGQWLHGAKQYFIQQFVDSGDLLGEGVYPLTLEQMQLLRDTVSKYIPNTHLRGI